MIEILSAEQLSFMLGEMISKLTEREQSVIRLRNGFCEGKVYTLEEVGKIHHITCGRVRQIEAKAVKKLRRMALDRKDCFTDYL